ncbi:PepSY-associated TM helix domain-containing protein [Sphingomonas mucosissima]|uniref:PepSY-associated TM helix n=1 Tax=Sphingomonas mucosissima TaxID=370959 RepID=A0A245ZJF9_9SPHN|nr:PepSY-associated TM helix domain-containing protein [Sphingomonas mucosissima]OWK29879.1 hypothetical protein SPMU_23010 [Sphingomonas mucosissima]
MVATARPAKRRSLWWVVHSWAGFKLSIFLTFILATGTLAVFAHEIDWLITPAMRVAPRDAPHASWGSIADAAQRAAPDGALTTIFAPIDPWFAVEAWVSPEKGAPRRIYVDPWTGEVTGQHGWANVHRFLRQVHRHLMLPTKIGIPIVCSLALLLAASLVTGVVTYKKWWRGFFRWPHTGNTRRLTGDLHRLAGLWCLWFVALISLTGIWYLVETLGGNAPVEQPPEIGVRSPPTGRALDRLVAIAQREKPGLDIREIRFLEDQGVAFLGQDSAWLVRDRVNGVVIDPANGRTTMIMDGADLSIHQRISEMADPLHFGTFGGLPTKILWFIFGALMTALSVTGTMIYALRLSRSETGGGVRIAWRGMGIWRWIGLAAIIIALALTPFAIGGAG